MSHIVTIKTEVRDPRRSRAACRRLGLPEPVHGTATALRAARPPACSSGCPAGSTRSSSTPPPARSATTTTAGSWGDPEQLDRFLQAYAVEKATIEARKRGHTVVEQALADGSIKLTIQVGGAAVKTIEITVGPKGETKVETRGFTGGECREASRFVEQALGHADRRDADRRVLPGPAGRPGPPAVAADPPGRRHPARRSHPASPPSTRRPSMTLAERLSEYVRAALHRHLGPVLRARRRHRRDRPALPRAGLGPGHLGRRPRPGPGRPAPTAPSAVAGAADPLAAIRALGRPGHARRHGACWCSATSTGSWARAEVVQALDTPDRRRQAGPHLRRRPRPGRPDPRRAGEAVRRRRARPARPRPARGDRPRRSPPSRASCPRATAWTPSSTRRPG